MSNELAIEKENLPKMTGKYVPGPEEKAAMHFWETWGRSAYDSIAMNEPCEPPTNIVVHAHGEQFPMHLFLLNQFFEDTSTWPTLDGYNLECAIPANHFRALHQLAYTGYTRAYACHLFRELYDHVRLVRTPSGICDYILDMDPETSDARILVVARHILESDTSLRQLGCDKMKNGAAMEAMDLIRKCWVVLCPYKDVTEGKIIMWHDEILRDWQKWTDEIELSHEISRLEM